MKRILKSADASDPGFIQFKENLLAKFEERGRNMTHLDKLKRIGKAMAERIRSEATVPSSGIPGVSPKLSWRVGLLPYLGYKELHQKFDLERRFNSPINQRLIELIPPEFQTCSEAGKTNLVVPIASYSLFSTAGPPKLVKRVEDGIADTITIVEVDDEHAQTWTAPENFILDTKKPTKGMGEKFGFIVTIFGDGRVEKVNRSIGVLDFRAMVSYDAGDSYPVNSTREIVQTDFGLKGFGPKQQLVMLGAKGATNSVGNLRDGSGTTKLASSSTSAESDNNANNTTSSVSLSHKFLEGSLTALKKKNLTASFDYKFASLIVDDGSSSSNYGWCKAIQRPVLAPRWSVGVLTTVHDEKNKNFDPLKRTVAREKSRTYPGEEILEEKTGQVGLDAMIVLRKLVAEGKFGKYLTEQISVVNENPNRQKSRIRKNVDDNSAKKSTNQELYDSRKIPDLHFPGIEIHAGNTRAYHVKVARERGNDLLLLLEVEVRSIASRQSNSQRNRQSSRQNDKIQTTTMYVIDVHRGRELWKSAPLNTKKIREERKSALKTDAVFAELKELDQFLRENVALTELPRALTRDHVLKRLKLLSGKKNGSKLAFLAEAKFYLQNNLILQTDFTQFCIDTLGDQKKGLQLVMGDSQQKNDIIRQFLPLQYSLELSN